MIARIWHGWTEPEQADEYERVLRSEVIPAILARRIPGLRRIEAMRRNRSDEVEFVTIMRFDSIDSVKRFVGEDHEAAHVPDIARVVLKRFDERAEHYEVREEREA